MPQHFIANTIQKLPEIIPSLKLISMDNILMEFTAFSTLGWNKFIQLRGLYFLIYYCRMIIFCLDCSYT
jgi:hypothetical protein